MSTVHLTIEELIALKAANQPTVFEAILFFTATLPHYTEDEKDLFKFSNNLIDKLKEMNEEQYNGIDFSEVIDVSDTTEEFE